jgi:DNA polymerase-3 subunit beta
VLRLEELRVKVTCKQQDLSRGLSVVGHAVSSRSTLPILANILLATDQGRLRLSANNLEIGINCWVDAEILEEGSTTVPAKIFSDLISSLPQITIELTVPDETHQVNIKTPKTNSNIKGMDPSEFPVLPSAEGNELPVVLETAQFKRMINEVAIAADPENSRHLFQGIHVEVKNEQITLAAADSFRLAVRTAPLAGHTTNHDDILIPARTLLELARILPNEGSVQMIVTPNRSQVLFHSEQIDLVSRLIEATFPNFRGIIPKEYTTRAVLDTKDFAAAVKSVMPFARDSSNITRVKVSGGNGGEPGSLTLEATAEDVGDNVCTIDAAVDGGEQQVIFNAKYLSEVLAVTDATEVAVEMTSPQRPGLIRPVGNDDYTYIIMPMSSNR